MLDPVKLLFLLNLQRILLSNKFKQFRINFITFGWHFSYAL